MLKKLSKSFCGIFKVGLINIRSLRYKVGFINEFINEFSLSLICITETWTHAHDLPIIQAALPETHSIIHVPRSTNEQGGGVALVYHKSFHGLKILPSVHPITTFEYLAASFEIRNISLKLAVVYRPGRPGTDPEFLTEFGEFLHHFTNKSDNFVLCGDFNYWVDCPNMKPYSQNFMNLLDENNCQNYVLGPTHLAGHTLDLVICPSTKVNSLIKNINITPIDNSVSDHALITFDISIPRMQAQRKFIQFHNYRRLSPDTIKTKIATAIQLFDSSDTCNNLVDYHNNLFSSMASQFCPIVEKEILFKEDSPWFDGSVRALRRKRRHAERRWRRLRTPASRVLYTDARRAVVDQVAECKRIYYRDKVNNCKGDSRKLWYTMNGLLGRRSSLVFPDFPSEDILVSQFNNFFTDKIKSLRLEIDAVQIIDKYSDNYLGFHPAAISNGIDRFNPISNNDAILLMKKVRRTYCSRDPINFSKVFEFCEGVSSLIAAIINSSFEEGVFPTSEKYAVVRPLLKKPALDKNTLNNYRPVSNLSYLSKVVERAILDQLLPHLTANNVIPRLQSAFRQFHSTETALCVVYNDLILNVCDGVVSLLVLLDLSAAFDTIDHCLLMEDLVSFGISGTALSLIKSYLLDRKQSVEIGKSSSDPEHLHFGVPQGSILGPILFLIYASGLSDIISSHNVDFHLYADDSQIYLPINSIPDAKEKVAALLSDIKIWMLRRKLKLNEGKTEVILISGSNRNKISEEFGQFRFGDAYVPLSLQVRNIGVVFDPVLRFDKHISSVVRDCNFHLRNLSIIKKHLDKESLTTLIHALISSRLDYCNSVFLGLPKLQLKKLQLIQNRAARLILNLNPWDRITPSLIYLHWLPVKARIEFKICLLVFKTLKFKQPIYLLNLLAPYSNQSEMNLRCSDDPYRLSEPSAVRQRTLAERSFSYMAPRLYNMLPIELKSVDSLEIFKLKLKTYFFNLSFNVVTKELRPDYSL